LSQDNCDLDAQGVEYFVNDIGHIPSVYGFLFETATMVFILVSYVLKIIFYTDWRERLQKLWIQFAIVLVSVAGFVFRGYYFSSFNVNSFMFIVFLIYRT
jgi:hypothetical protein